MCVYVYVCVYQHITVMQQARKYSYPGMCVEYVCAGGCVCMCMCVYVYVCVCVYPYGLQKVAWCDGQMHDVLRTRFCFTAWLGLGLGLGLGLQLGV